MALVPGATITAAQLLCTVGAPTFFNNGFAMTGSAPALICIDIGGPAGNSYQNGLRVNASGAIYAATTPAGTDSYVNGLRVSASGQLVVSSPGTTTAYSSGNPIDATGSLSIN